MKIAVTYESGYIFQHFGHTQQFKLYDVQDACIVSTQLIQSNGCGHSALAVLLSTQKIDVLICGGIGGCAQNALSQVGIRLYAGCQGEADDAVEAFLAGELCYNPNPRCTHHGHGAHDIGCNEHSCH